MYYVYVLKNKKDGRYYIGSTNNLQRRLKEHANGKTKSLLYRRPLELVYYEECKTLTEARRREKIIKQYKAGKAFKRLIATAHVAQSVEHLLGKEEVTGSIPVVG